MRDLKAALFLLSKGADPNKAARDIDGDVSTPLWWAAANGSTEVCRSLLASGARQDIDTGGEYFVDNTGCVCSSVKINRSSGWKKHIKLSCGPRRVVSRAASCKVS